MTTLFSVAVPAYNCAEFLPATLDAILSQSPPPDEVVVVDDGSTDDTPDVLHRYNDRVRIIRVENGGPGAARKIAVESCRNKWIALCDSDDIWEFTHLQRFAQMLKDCPGANILCTNFVSFGPTANLLKSHFESADQSWLTRHSKAGYGDFVELSDPYRALLEFNPMYPSGLAITREIYDLTGGIKREYSRWPAEDSEFSRRLVAAPEARVFLDSVVSWNYRRHGQNFSETQWKNVHARARILREHLLEDVVPAHLVPEVESWARKVHGRSFDIAFWTGHYAAARNVYRELPQQQRSLARFLRYCLSGLRCALLRRAG